MNSDRVHIARADRWAASVTAIWGMLPQDVQRELFEHAVSAQDDATRERFAIFLHAMHFRTTDALKAGAMPEPDSLGG